MTESDAELDKDLVDAAPEGEEPSVDAANAGNSPEESPEMAVAAEAEAEAPANEEIKAAVVDSDETDDDEEVMEWYILKVQVNREDSIRDALLRRVKIEGLEEYFEQIVVPTEEVAEFNKNGKRRVVKKKLYPGYILVHMVINDATWFVVRETPGVGDFTGSAGKPTPLASWEVDRILKISAPKEDGVGQVRTAIPFRIGDRVRVKDGNFQNFEGDVEVIDEIHGRVTVVIQIFSRPTPVELEHWQIEAV